MEYNMAIEPYKPIYSTHSELGPSAKARRVKVTAMVTRRPDDSEYTTYKVEEVDDSSDSDDQCALKPFDYRRIRSQSESTVRTDDSNLHTPTSPFRGLPLVEWPLSPPPAPRIPFPPSPKEDLCSPPWAASLSARRGIGLGLDLSGCHAKEQSSVAYHYPHYQSAARAEAAGYHGFEPFTPSTSSASSSSSEDEEPYYYLPSGLFTPELEMSAAEFKESVNRWIQRRRESMENAQKTTVQSS